MCLDVLNVIAMGAENPTDIMYGANLSSTTLRPLLQTLFERRYIYAEDVRGRRHYRITTTGERTLQCYRRAVTGFTESTAILNPAVERPSQT